MCTKYATYLHPKAPNGAKLIPNSTIRRCSYIFFIMMLLQQKYCKFVPNYYMYDNDYIGIYVNTDIHLNIFFQCGIFYR